ncbi:hypothetical protein FA95DRAFT_648392 [Auriscalpium vulgare]|uniref:Uncharacterized protein n=1 Tax=Auriscalpium vulgare TaxID=40419 RepID=A0ACB8RD14_9AGAM|nr:hypothetical protein FA95DRAFT_648392 [Auriscalpium vulgare]
MPLRRVCPSVRLLYFLAIVVSPSPGGVTAPCLMSVAWRSVNNALLIRDSSHVKFSVTSSAKPGALSLSVCAPSQILTR